MDKVSLSPSAVRQAMSPNRLKAVEKKDEAKEAQSFGEMLKNSVEDVNNTQATADKSIAEFLSGGNIGLHETMLNVEKADVSLRLLVQVRNKAVEAYREIMRMQV